MTSTDENYFRLKQNQATNLLARFTTTKHETISDGDGTKIAKTKFSFSYGACSVTLLLDPSRNYGLSTTTQKLYRYICCQFTERGCNENQIMLYMPTLLKDLGLKDYNTNREVVKKDCERLLRTNIRWEINKGGKSKKCKTPNGSFNLISSFKFANNYLTVEVCSDFLNYMKNWSLINYPKAALQISAKSKYSFSLVDKIIETSRQRASFSISVKSLFNVCVATGMLTIEEVKQTPNRSFKEKIVSPFERALSNNNGLFEWKYKHSLSHKKIEDWLNDYVIIDNYLGGDAPP